MAVPAAAAQSDAPAPAGKVRWYSTGDAYSSGDGVVTTAGTCAQTRRAWGPAAAALLSTRGWSVPTPVFTACSGRSLADQYGGPAPLWDWAEKQGAPATPSFDVVTLSFAGAGLDLGRLVTECFTAMPTGWSTRELPLDDCDLTEDALLARVDALADPGAMTLAPEAWGPGERVRGNLADFYALMVRRHLAARGRLVVLGYPRLFAPSRSWAPWEQGRCHGVTATEADMLGRVADHLDAVVRAQVGAANKALGAERVLYVSGRSVFAGHELCGTKADWFTGLAPAPSHLALESSTKPSTRLVSGFHPNGDGQAGAAEAVADRLAASGLLAGPVPLSVATRRVDETGTEPQSYEIHLQVPVVSGGASAAAMNNVLDGDANAVVRAFKEDLASNASPGPASTLSSETTTALNDAKVLSLRVVTSQLFSGAAHGSTTTATYTFDAASGRRYALAQLFSPGSDYLAVLSREARSRLPEEATETDGSAPKAENFAAWALTPTGLEVTFAEYQVGPYALGRPVVVIPYAALRSVAAAGGPLAGR